MMNDIVDFYEQQAKERLSSLPWLAKIQTNALSQLRQRGFPTRHDEDWKYTSVDTLLNQPFAVKKESSLDGATAQSRVLGVKSGNENLDCAVAPSRLRLSLRNGIIDGFEELANQLPSGVLVLPLSKALYDHPDLIKSHLGTSLEPEHGFHYLNNAMIQDGVVIYIPKGVRINEPITLGHFQSELNQALYLRHLIIAEPDSQATILEEYRGEGSYLTNTITEMMLGAGAKLTHYKIQNESQSAYHLGHLSVKQSANSQLTSHSLSLGGKLVRSDTSLYLQEEYASCILNGIYAPGEGQHVDHHTKVMHLVPNCTSDQDYKGILSGHSRAVFNGKVKVEKNAQHTKARQYNKNVLLSAHAEVDTKPQLEIFADDVMCSHGATVGQLDEEALFYLASRGIDRLEASRYLIQAFAIDNLRLISDPELAEWMGQLLTQKME